MFAQNDSFKIRCIRVKIAAQSGQENQAYVDFICITYETTRKGRLREAMYNPSLGRNLKTFSKLIHWYYFCLRISSVMFKACSLPVFSDSFCFLEIIIFYTKMSPAYQAHSAPQKLQSSFI